MEKALPSKFNRQVSEMDVVDNEEATGALHRDLELWNVSKTPQDWERPTANAPDHQRFLKGIFLLID